jgi:thiol-disulfide isomerase/thioredoxin
VNKQTRYWVRRILLLAMMLMIAFALYQALRGQGGQPEEGQEAPDFQLTTLDGKQMSLQQLRGKGVLINFWGTWCPPCRSEMPVLEKAYEKYRDQGFEIVSVNIAETDVAVASFAKQYGLTFPIWMDRERDVVRLYKINPIPTSFFVDPNGVIVKKVEGPLNLDQLDLYIHQILPQK